MNKKALHCIVLLPLVAMFIGCSSTKKEDRLHGLTGTQLLTEGKDNLASGSYKESIERFDIIQARYPEGAYAEQAKLSKIYAFYLNRDHKEALAEADNFIKMYPNHPYVDYVWYMKGLINFDRARSILDKLLPPDHSQIDQKQLTESLDAFLVVLEKYPNGLYAEDSAKRVTYLRNMLAKSEIHIAQFYLDRNAPVGAANRAQYVLDNYDGSPLIADALYIQVRAYRALNLPEIAEDRLRIFQMNFPNDKRLSRL